MSKHTNKLNRRGDSYLTDEQLINDWNNNPNNPGILVEEGLTGKKLDDAMRQAVMKLDKYYQSKK